MSEAAPASNRISRISLREALDAALRYGPEAVAFSAILTVAVLVRLIRLGELPTILTGDELENLQTAYHIAQGTGPGPFGFDWKPGPILGLYPLAWTVQVFGGSVMDFRMYPAIFSLLTIVAFYAVARRAMGAPAALAAMLLLSTNLWFLNFSRTAWDNVNSGLFAIAACWATLLALQKQRWWWWALSGVFCALGLYGYFSGRFIFVAVTLVAVVAVATRQAPWRPTARGLVIAGVVCAALFAPMAKNISDDWEKFNSRTQNVSVFNTHEPYEGSTNGWVIAWKNLWLNYRGLVLNDGSEVQRGFWGRYHPDRRSALELVGTHLFLAGLVVGAFRWRQTYAWWAFFAPMTIAEVFSRGTPDLARALVFAPFYFLFIGIFFDEALLRVRAPALRRPLPRVVRGAALALLAALVTFIAWRDVDRYFSWQQREQTKLERLPGIDRCEWDLWRGLAIQAASIETSYTLVNEPKFREARRQLACSPTVNRELFREQAPP